MLTSQFKKNVEDVLHSKGKDVIDEEEKKVLSEFLTRTERDINHEAENFLRFLIDELDKNEKTRSFRDDITEKVLMSLTGSCK